MQAKFMTFDEAYKFLEEIALPTFPLVFKALQESPNPSRTVELWAKSLSNRVTMAEAAQVLDAWLTGQTEMFSYADQFAWPAAIIRQVQHIRGKRYAAQLKAETYANLPPRDEFVRLNYDHESQTLANLEHTTRMAAESRIEFSPHIAQLLGRS